MTVVEMRRATLAGVLIAVGALFSVSAAQYGNVVQGLCFSVGLFGVLCTRSNLFTGQVLRIARVWRRQETICDVLGWWVAVWSLNLAGAVCVALMASWTGVDASMPAMAKAAMPWHEVIVRAAMCNVMVCLAVRAFACSRGGGAVDALASCALPVACFVACGWEHSVADMLYMPLGVMGGAVTAIDAVRVVALATVGNVVGGVAFAYLAMDGGGE